MKKNLVMMLLSVWMLAGSCGAILLSPEKVMAVERGMTPQEVKKLLGTPDGKSFYGEVEEWIYQAEVGTSVFDSSYNLVAIRFINGRVQSMETQHIPRPNERPAHKH